jgi:cysteinyl-tRNA synthetase
MKAARAAKERAAEEKRLTRERRLAEEAVKTAAAAEKAKTPPQDMFKTDEFSAWDANVVPTKLKGGDDVPKRRRKKLEKDWKAQKVAHEKWKDEQKERMSCWPSLHFSDIKSHYHSIFVK